MKWARRLSERVGIKPSGMPRRLIALDEIRIKVNGLEYWIYNLPIKIYF